MTKIALTIAGSDSGGGAGIQADLKTFAMHRIHGASAITCVTAQNTVGVSQVAGMDISLVKAQIKAVADDLEVNAIKTGMLLNSEIIAAVAQQIEQYRWRQLVVDPVMVSRSGVQLIDDDAIASLRNLLIPQALIVTPNRYEAQILSGRTIDNLDELKQAAIAIYEATQVVVLAKGGSLSAEEQGVDIWYDGQEIRTLCQKTIPTKNTHGTGCTLAAAICANLAQGIELWQAVVEAKAYVTQALEHSLDIGAGSGPVGHFFPLL
ncbi:MAG: bifunctional hydroxymethylpyrimidine kinase/phosphomethylpyrimidine kinase [Cyanobacteria bacterium J06621_12]